MKHEDNVRLTRTGPDAPMGRLFRRYWMPIAAAGELTEAKPIKAARILGEDRLQLLDGPLPEHLRGGAAAAEAVGHFVEGEPLQVAQLDHAAMMHCIELYGTVVAPAVRAEIAKQQA